MKTIIGIIFMLLPLVASAQLTANQQNGAFSIGGAGSSVDDMVQEAKRYMTQELAGHPFRKIRGKIYNMQDIRLLSHMEVKSKESNGILIGSQGIDVSLAITNYTGEVVSGRVIPFLAIRVGTYNLGWKIVDLYDCGTRLTTEEEKQIFDAAKARDEAAKNAAKVKSDAAKQHADATALKANQDAAKKGDSYGLLRMGERYRDGDGVEKDLAKAKEYFQKAADAGSPTAADELLKLLK